MEGDAVKEAGRDFGQICPDFDPPSNLLPPPRFIVTLNYLLRPTDTAVANQHEIRQYVYLPRHGKFKKKKYLKVT